MVPELRAMRLKEIAGRVRDEFGGDLSAALAARVKEARKVLKKSPGIADPGADRILLFGGIAPVAAIPSNCPQVLVRIQQGPEGGAYNKTYREAQEMVEAQVAGEVQAPGAGISIVEEAWAGVVQAEQAQVRGVPDSRTLRVVWVAARRERLIAR